MRWVDQEEVYIQIIALCNSECYSIKFTSLKMKGLKSFVKGTFVGKILWSDRPKQCRANNAAIDLFSYESDLFSNFFGSVSSSLLHILWRERKIRRQFFSFSHTRNWIRDFFTRGKIVLLLSHEYRKEFDFINILLPIQNLVKLLKWTFIFNSHEIFAQFLYFFCARDRIKTEDGTVE